MATNINIENSFNTDNRSIYTYMSQPGLGLYIPLYQREYSWDKNNIEQLLEDISKGIYRIAENADDKEIRFLGTIITVKESDKRNIHPKDPQAIPTGIEKIIDGQQRLSTIAIIACILTKYFDTIQKKAKKYNEIEIQVEEICTFWSQRLSDIFSFDLRRGTPKWKPRIIRGNVDGWVREGDMDKAYPSYISNFIAATILAYFEKTQKYPKADKSKHGTILYQNIKAIEEWLNDDVLKAHINKSEDFATATAILSRFTEDTIWSFPRPDLMEIIETKEFDSDKKPAYFLCELVQLIAVSHYLLDRCCFTIIQPTDDDWAFDMFQSLNATGTPLTALETFKPTIVNETTAVTGNFKGSDNEESFNKVENLFSGSMSAKDKSKLTNDFLTSFFVSYNGQSLSSHFSYQRKMLINSYSERSTSAGKSRFIRYMGQYADFYRHIWLDALSRKSIISNLVGFNDGELASLLIQFLKESNHKMAITVLGNFYRNIYDNKENAANNFIDAVKAVGAFYILWRSSFSNSGLDTVYRDFFKSENKGWKYENGIDVKDLKDHFITSLSNKGISDKESWIKHAKTRLNYEDAGSYICRLILLMSYHDTECDNTSSNIGLMKYARVGYSSYLTLHKWNSPSLKSLEHIAPQTNNSGWDEDIYDGPQTLHHSIGNLTLLPQEINSSAGNKGWEEKCLYYSCINESSIDKLREIDVRAKSHGIELKESTISLLKDCSYNSHIAPVLSLYNVGKQWNKEIIERRTERILDISWEILKSWLY